MTPSDIQAAYARANDVLNGFRRPSTRIAKDVVNLIRFYNSKPDYKPKEEPKVDMPDFLKDLFGCR